MTNEILTLEQWLDIETRKIDTQRTCGMANDCGRIQRGGDPNLLWIEPDYLLTILEEEDQPLVYLEMLKAFQEKDPRFSWDARDKEALERLALIEADGIAKL